MVLKNLKLVVKQEPRAGWKNKSPDGTVQTVVQNSRAMISTARNAEVNYTIVKMKGKTLQRVSLPKRFLPHDNLTFDFLCSILLKELKNAYFGRERVLDIKSIMKIKKQKSMN